MCKMEEGGGRGGREREDGGRASMIAKVISSTSTRLVQQRLDRGLHGAVVHNNSAGFILPLPRLGYGSVGSRRRQQLYQSQESKASGTMSGLDERGDESRKTANGEKRDKNTFAADTNAAAAIDFFRLVTSMKTTPRTGWVQRRVDKPESIADHSYRMAMMAMLAAPLMGLDAGKCVCMALTHDLSESIVGDIPPSSNIGKVEKQKLEADAMERIQAMIESATAPIEKIPMTSEESTKSSQSFLLPSQVGRHVANLWQEYDSGESPEAVLLKDLDKLEMILQAHEYETEGKRYDLQSFFDSTAGKFRTSIGRAWADEVIRLRTERHCNRQM